MAFDRSTAFMHTVRNNIGLLLVLLLLLGQYGALAQTTSRKYLVLLRDKANSPFSISRPEQFLSQRAIQRRQKQSIAVQERDLPVNPAYVTQIGQTGAKVWFTSRWFNAVLVEATDAVIANVQKLPFVKGLEFNRPLANARAGATVLTASAATPNSADKFGEVQALNYGNSLAQVRQLGVDQMHEAGYRGEGMLIGVLDSGFLRADRVPYLKPLFDEKRVLATYDFVAKETSVYEDDSHGMSCLSAIAATADNQLYGTAFKASFILLRTEDVASEQPIEEANWLFGIEYADSAGVDVISSSLGYTVFPQFPSGNYTYANMNGITALSSRAAQIASETGMVIVVAAGNDGDDAWRYISAPSDAAGVLAVGAVTQAGQRAVFSSLGPSADGRVKPDLAARGQGTIIGSPGGQIVAGNGTSFATPLVAGLAAGFWQANPRLTAIEVTDALRRTGSQYTTPDAQIGYGIPRFAVVPVLANEEPTGLLPPYPNPFSDTEPLQMQWGNLSARSARSATLTDPSGRVVWQRVFPANSPDTFVLPSLNLMAGYYFMTLVSGEQRKTVKVLKR